MDQPRVHIVSRRAFFPLALQDVVAGDVVLASITGRPEADPIELALEVRRTKLCMFPTIALEAGASQWCQLLVTND
jgi:hypothetical protein